jgi:hypothetical protein
MSGLRKRNAYRILVGKPEVEGPLGRPRLSVWTISKWILERQDGIDMAQDRDQWMTLVNTVLKLRVPQNAGKFLSGCTIGGSSRRAQLRD